MMRTTKTFNHRIYKKKLKKFILDEGQHIIPRAALKIGKSEIYVRKWNTSAPAAHKKEQVFLDFANRRRISILDIATLRIHESAQRQGHFKKLLRTSEKLASNLGYDVVHIECVYNENLHPFLRRSGYQQLPELQECYAKGVSA